MVKIDTVRNFSKCFKILANQFYEWHIYMYKRYRMLNECRCKFKRVANETTTRRMRRICVCGIAGVSLFLIYASNCSISLFSFEFCLLSAFLLYSIRILANLYKRLTIIKNLNALLLILLKNMLRICFAYGTCFLYSQYLLNVPNAYEYKRIPGNELANIVICKQIRAIMVFPLFLGCFWSHSFK